MAERAPLTPALRVVQPSPRMANVKAPWLTWRENGDGSRRYYFQPRSSDRAQGWGAVRLHDQFERPIADPLKAAEACRALADIYTRWRAGEPGYGPHRIDKLGRVVDQQPRKARRGRRYKPGQVGAMAADYMAHAMFAALDAATQKEYRVYLGLLVEKFGDRFWWEITAGAARQWIDARGEAFGRSGAHALYRTVRAFFNRTRLVYVEEGHPGIVPDEARNPFTALNLSLPVSKIILWPRAAIDAFVGLADAMGQPSIGDALVMMSWLGIRRQDWLDWPANSFDRELLAFAQEKTLKPLVIPWREVPPLVERIEAARRRRTADAVTATTFFHDPQGLPWGSPARFRESFNAVRAELAKRHPTFPTRYYVGLVDGDPLCLPTRMLTVRTLRHTCITLNHDAGISRDLMPALTGHEPGTIDEVLAHYRARTADQAKAALALRVAHEAKGETA